MEIKKCPKCLRRSMKASDIEVAIPAQQEIAYEAKTVRRKVAVPLVMFECVRCGLVEFYNLIPEVDD